MLQIINIITSQVSVKLSFNLKAIAPFKYILTEKNNNSNKNNSCKTV